MPMFRKKPVVIEARRMPNVQDWSAGVHHNLMSWCGGKPAPTASGSRNGIAIKTLEGTMTATPGDWIIKGVNGEFYPCKPDIFEKTYEAVEA